MSDSGSAAPGFVLPERATPVRQASGLDAPYWDGAGEDRLVLQRCNSCHAWQWGPEWICRKCRSFDVGWAEVPNEGGVYAGRIYSWERVWHATHRLLPDHVPYVVLLVELPDAENVRLVGNLRGDPRREVQIGAAVHAVFEHHERYTLVQWDLA